MQSTREAQGLLFGTLFALAIIGAVASYWAVMGPNTILNRDDNPRLVEKRARILRGLIVDRNDNILANSVQDDQGVVSREYPYPSMYSAIGYYSLQYGEGGTEATYNDILNGDAQEQTWADFVDEEMLHLPQSGVDIRLTLDLQVQNRVAELMAEHAGAVVVISVPSGEVIALLSVPTYDSNTLDSTWDSLIESEGNPFFNRVLQGNYQAGSSTQTILLATALSHNISLESSFENANRAVVLDEISIECSVEPPSEVLTLAEAYRYGCPAPFVEITNQIGLGPIESAFDQFRPYLPMMLPHFVAELDDESGEMQSFTLEDALGQGSSTITPLQLAAITAAIANDGETSSPFTLLAQRQPGTNIWIPEDVASAAIPIMATPTARDLSTLMSRNLRDNRWLSPTGSEIKLGGQAAIAYSGERSHVWFTGFARHGAGPGVAVAVVIEDSDDTNLATQLGIATLKATVGDP